MIFNQAICINLAPESFIYRAQKLLSFCFSLPRTHIHFLSILSAWQVWAHGHQCWGREGGVLPSETYFDFDQEREKGHFRHLSHT